MFKRQLSFLILILLALSAKTQVLDDFTDGDFITNPTWTEDTADFIIDAGELRLDAPAASSERHVVTANNFLDNTTWTFKARMGFNPSSTSKILAYLVSNEPDLQGSLNGYFVMIGNSADEISLYRQDGNSTAIIIDGTDDAVDASSVDVSIRVTRDNLGNWELFRNVSGEGEISEGTVFDDTYISTAYFGFLTDYIASRSTLFYFDDISITSILSIDSVLVTGDSSIIVDFNQAIDQITGETSSNYTLDNSISIISAIVDEADSSRVSVVTNPPLDDDDYLLTASNLRDALTGTLISNPLTSSFSYEPLNVDTVITLSDTLIQLGFNQALDTSTAELASNYLVNGGIGIPASTRLNGVDSSMVELRLASPLSEGFDYTVKISNVQNASTNSTFNGTTDTFQFIVPLLIDSSYAANDSMVVVQFNKRLDPVSATVEANYLLVGYGNPSSATLSNDSTVKLTYTSKFPDDTFTLEVNGVKNDDNTLTGTNLSSQFSYLSLQILSISVISPTEIGIVFNQAVNASSVTLASNYSVNYSIGNPTEVIYDATSANQVSLIFEGLVNNSYQMTVNPISNALLNAQTDTTDLGFEIELKTPFGSVLINELMVDPSPPVNLPEEEYIELFNNSSNYLNLQDFSISGGTLSDSVVLEPNGYLILARASDTASLSTFGNIVVVSSFPGLTNSGRALALYDNLGNLVDTLSYNNNWYNDPDKDDGGYSIERINPSLACSGIFNWRASDALNGGTPGIENSHFDDRPDTNAPFLVDIDMRAEDTISFLFSEPIDTSVVTIASFLINESSSGLSLERLNEDLSTVDIILENPILIDTFNTFQVINVQDCQSNALADTILNLYNDKTPPNVLRTAFYSAENIDVFFSEPIDQEQALIEENFIIDGHLNPNKISFLSDSSMLRLEFEEPFAFDETNYLLTISNLSDSASNIIEGVITTNVIAKQSIISVDVLQNNFLQVRFDTSIDSIEAAILNNYLLDELYSPISIIYDQNMPNLVQLIFDAELDKNEDYTLKVNNLKDSSGSFLSTPLFEFFYDLRAPRVVSVLGIDSSSLVIKFDEPVALFSAENVSNYGYRVFETGSFDLEKGIRPARALLLDDTTVNLTFETGFIEEEILQLAVLGVEDTLGNTITTSNNLNTRSGTFLHDNLPPSLSSLGVRDSVTVILRFSEPIAFDSLSEEDVLINNSYHPDQIEPNLFFSDILRVILPGQEPLNSQNKGFILNMQDSLGNKADTVRFEFDNDNPSIFNAIPLSDSTLEVLFSEEINAQGSIPENYLIDQQHIPTSISAFGSSSILTFNDLKFEDDRLYQLNILNLEDLEGKPLLSNSLNFRFESGINSFKLLSENRIQIVFDGEISQLSTQIFSVNNGIGNPTIITKNEEDSDESISVFTFFFRDNFSPEITYGFSWSSFFTSEGLRVPAQTKFFRIDELPPKVLSIEQLEKTGIAVTFDEPLEEISAKAPNHYTVLGFGNPLSVEVRETENLMTTVSLVFGDTWVPETTYQLILERIEDLSGNFINDTVTFSFEAKRTPTIGELLITEIFADPTPTVGLPDGEFVEIFNPTNDTLDLDEVRLSDESKVVSLGPYRLPPLAYLILSDDGLVDEYTSFGNVLGVPGFIGINNSGEKISVLNESDTIASIEFNTAWYDDAQKDDGGYSLEIKYLNTNCPGQTNWAASSTTNGGTPGQPSSLLNTIEDIIPPTVIGAQIIHQKEIRLSLSEAVDKSSVSIEDLSGQAENDIIGVSALEDQIVIELATPISSGSDYTLSINNIEDCFNNIIVDTTISLVLPKSPVFLDLFITEIMADPDPPANLPNAEYFEVYNQSDDDVVLDEIDIRVNGGEAATSGIIPSGAYGIFVTNSAVDQFRDIGITHVFGVSGWDALTNEAGTIELLRNDSLVASTSYRREWYNDNEKSQGGFSLESIRLSRDCEGSSNWTASLDLNGGSPGSENSVFSDTPDLSLPALSAAQFLGDSSIALSFSESVDAEAINISENFSGTPENPIIEVLAEETSLTLAVQAPLKAGDIYTLEVRNIADCAGNMLPDTSITLTVPSEAGYLDLLITEIMADPDPAAILPSVEYLEIYNPSENTISLSGLVLLTNGKEADLNGVLASNQYLILTSSSSDDEFDSSVDAIGISGWSALTNSEGEIKIIRQRDAELIHLVNYNISWYQDNEKEDGGWSLEMIDVSNPCGEANNWVASISADQGTPSTANSLSIDNPDLTGPIVLSAIASSKQEIIIRLDEIVNAKTVDEAGFSISPTLSLESLAVQESLKEIRIQFSEDLESRQTYEIAISNIKDCVGNTISSGMIELVIPDTVEAKDVLINEVLFNPRVGGVDFVELYNNSDKPVDLKNWHFIGSNSEEIITEDHLLLLPQRYIAFSENSQDILSNYPSAANLFEVNDLPSLPNDEGYVGISDSTNNILDEMEYDEDDHFDIIRDKNGVSLERISFDQPSLNRDNWKSSSSTGNFATPGYKNSQNLDGDFSEEEISLSTRIFTPDNDGQDDFVIINYKMSQTGTFASISVFNSNGRLVKMLRQNVSLDTEGFVQWDGTDDRGNLLKFGTYIILFEIYAPEGRNSVLKETVVLGRQF